MSQNCDKEWLDSLLHVEYRPVSALFTSYKAARKKLVELRGQDDKAHYVVLRRGLFTETPLNQERWVVALDERSVGGQSTGG